MKDDRPLRKQIKYAAIYWFVRFLIFVANLIPRRLWLGFCGWLGVIACHLLPKEREKTIRHLTLAFGKELGPVEIKRMSKEVFRMIGVNGGEILRAVAIRTLEDLDRVLVSHGYENFEKAFARGKGVVFVTCHVGAFELQIANMTLRGLNPLIVGTPLKDPRLNELLFSSRSAHGGIAVERGKEGMKLVKGLLQGGTVALLIDQDTKVKSRFVNFFGMPASTPAGVALLALKTKAAVVPSYIHYNKADGKQHMYLLPEFPLIDTGNEENDLVANTQLYTSFIEDAIRKHPTQWVWMHERWKTKPGEEIR